MTDSPCEPTGLRVRFGTKAPDTEGRLARVLPGRLVIESQARHRVHTTLHLLVELEGSRVAARGVVERMVPLGPWPVRRPGAAEGPVALTVLLITECPALEELAARLAWREERRRHPRHDAILRVTLGSSSALGSTRALNVSRGGLFLETPLRLEAGAPLAFRLHLAGDVPQLRVEARVVHLQAEATLADGDTPQGVGVAFGDLLPHDAAHLDAFLESLRTPED